VLERQFQEFMFSIAFINRKILLNLYTSPYLQIGAVCGRRDNEKLHLCIKENIRWDLKWYQKYALCSMGLGYRPAARTCGCGNELWVP
jgi:hypothetical protein